jgi:hypothetical protein
MTEDMRYHQCARGERWDLTDARGIFCCFVCPKCERAKRTRYRPEIFEDSQYWADEPIEPEDY